MKDIKKQIQTELLDVLSGFDSSKPISRAALIERFADDRKAGLAMKLFNSLPVAFRIGRVEADGNNDQDYSLSAEIISDAEGADIEFFSFSAAWKLEHPKEKPKAKRRHEEHYIMYLMLGPGHPNYDSFMRHFGGETDEKNPEAKMKQRADSAVDTINSMLRSENTPFSPLKKLFDTVPGWTVPVLLDYTTDYSSRCELGGKGDGIDRLGEYISSIHPAKPQSYPEIRNTEIKLYCKAIEEYCSCLNIQKRESIYAHVLAHELLHALQDYMMGIAWRSRFFKPNECAVLETHAEYFALQFVKKALQDDPLYQILRNERASQLQNQWLRPYAEAILIQSDEEFLRSFQACCDDTLGRCYQG